MSVKRFALVVRLALGVVVTSLLILGTPRPASAASIIFVRSIAHGANNGTSWLDAYHDLQDAIAAAASGDQIWVAQGTYLPTQGSDRSISFHLKSGVSIYGGFRGNETQLNPRNPYAHKTILSGDIGVYGDSSDNSYHVVDASGVDRTASMDGFTIRDGNANGDNPNDFTEPVRSEGGGIYDVSGAPVLSNLIIRDNRALDMGGGMFIEYHQLGSPTLTNVFFERNFAGYDGGGILAFDSSPSLINVTVSSNEAQEGGGMYAYGVESSPQLTNVTFAGNNASGAGGGMVIDVHAAARIENATFSNNQAVDSGGGLDVATDGAVGVINATFNSNSAGNHGGAIDNIGASPTLRNITVGGNTAGLGGGMSSDNASAPVVENSIFWGDNTEVTNASGGPAFTDSIVQGGCPANAACTNVLDADPALGKLKYNGGDTYTMALGDGSAAIDAGGANAACPAQDQRGLNRPQGLACDMGAYEVGAMIFYSQGAYDGSVLETGYDTGVGGTVNSTGQTFQVGDIASNANYHGFLSFDTSALPNSANIVLGKVAIKQSDTTGGDPFKYLGTLSMSLAKPYFGSSLTLVSSDFQAPAVVGQAGDFGSVPSGSWYIGALNSAGYSAINKPGTTQLRLYFSIATNTDHLADNASFYSGDGPSENWPFLIVYYNAH